MLECRASLYAPSVFIVCEKDLSQSCYISGQRKTCVVQAVFDLTAGLINPVVVILNANLLHALNPITSQLSHTCGCCNLHSKQEMCPASLLCAKVPTHTRHAACASRA